MFQHRSREFNPHVSAIAGHLRAIEKELGGIGQSAGRRASSSASAAGSQIADAIGPILNEIIDRFGRGQRIAADEAVSFGNEAAKMGARSRRRCGSANCEPSKKSPPFHTSGRRGGGPLDRNSRSPKLASLATSIPSIPAIERSAFLNWQGHPPRVIETPPSARNEHSWSGCLGGSATEAPMKTRLLIVLTLAVLGIGGALAIINNTCKSNHRAWCAPASDIPQHPRTGHT